MRSVQGTDLGPFNTTHLIETLGGRKTPIDLALQGSPRSGYAGQLAGQLADGVSAKSVLLGKGLDPLGVPTKLYIGGEWLSAEKNRTLKVYDPATERVLYRCPNASAGDVSKAVGAARAAFDTGPWGKMSGAERATYLDRFAEALKKNKEELAIIESRNQGKPLAEAKGDVDYTIFCFEYNAKLARQLDERQGTPLELRDATLESKLNYEAIGVVGAIVPWNYPMMMAAWKVAPALAAGCTVVLKPSEITPMTAMKLAEIAEEIGLPPGVLNVVPGTGKEAGSALVKHPGVDKVAFTGGEVTGKKIRLAAAERGIPVTTELGGKSPAVVFDDADLDRALHWIAFGIFGNQGEVCSATSRLIVHESIADELIERLVALTNTIKIGPGVVEGVEMGPLVSKAHYEKVLSLIDSAKKEGATLVCGGGPTNHPSGWFVQPTIFKDVTPDMTIWKREIFGPVLAVCTFKTEEEAIRLANHPNYDLAASVFSENRERLDRVCKQISATTKWQNCSQPVDADGPPWGGMRKSGIGRELGPNALDNYLLVSSTNRYKPEEPFAYYSGQA